MKQHLLLLFWAFSTNLLLGQTTILNFEAASTSTTYQYFGSSLDGTLNNIIANPDPSGINTSAMVADHIKPAGSQVWAGAFPNPAPSVPADMNTNSNVCLKVWTNQTGNVGIKLEGSSTGANWVRTVDVNQTQQWTEVCVDVNLPSIEGPFQPAKGHVYPIVTLFFDFGVSPTADRTYYWDDLIVKSGGGPTEGDITFSVDMNDYQGTFTTVYVSGGFNNWSGDQNPLSDSDGDGVWTGILADIPIGLQEYKFTLDNWAAQEQFSPFTPCVITDPSGQFVNRSLVVSGDAALPTYCFNSCFACGEGINLTFEIGAGNITVDPTGLFLAGGGNFGNPGDFPLSGPDGNGIYRITVERQKGFSSFYTFTNGNCPDYSCKENIAGQDCANPANFNDRFLPAVQSDTTVSTCFGICTDNTADCSGGASPGNVTFQVDMSKYTGAFTLPHISGSFNGWSGDGNPLADPDGNEVWETTLFLQPGNYEFKFTLDNWAADEQFMSGDPCTVTDPSGQFVNRIVSVDGDSTICFEYNTCETCEMTDVREVHFDPNLFQLQPVLAGDFTKIIFAKTSLAERSLSVLHPTGQLLQTVQLPGDVLEYQLNTGHLPDGLYFVHVVSDGTAATKRMVAAR